MNKHKDLAYLAETGLWAIAFLALASALAMMFPRTLAVFVAQLFGN